MSAQQSPAAAARQVADSDTLEHLARVGLIAYGVVHLLVAWLALQIAWSGGSGEDADQTGALRMLAETPVGGPLLWVLGLGLFALALWQAAEVLRWRHGWRASGEQRRTAVTTSAKAVGKAAVYTWLGVVALDVANGPSESGRESQQQAAAGVLGWPGGQWLVAAAGLAVIAAGVYHVHKGVTARFLRQIDLDECSASARRLVTRVGRVGYPGKGVALAAVGGLLVWAALTVDPERSAGLDGALRTVRQAPLGTWVLTAIAVGIAAFGLFCLFRARYPERR